MKGSEKHCKWHPRNSNSKTQFVEVSTMKTIRFLQKIHSSLKRMRRGICRLKDIRDIATNQRNGPYLGSCFKQTDKNVKQSGRFKHWLDYLVILRNYEFRCENGIVGVAKKKNSHLFEIHTEIFRSKTHVWDWLQNDVCWGECQTQQDCPSLITGPGTDHFGSYFDKMFASSQ